MNPTPTDYTALRDYLDDAMRPGNEHWPILYCERCHGSGYDTPRGTRCSLCDGDGMPTETADVAAARAAWWTRLVAPRREADADDAADRALEAAGLGVAGWFRDGGDGLWKPTNLNAAALATAPRLTTRQLRARLAFVGATGAVCTGCAGLGIVVVDSCGRDGRGNWIRKRCPDCRGTGRILPETVPQRDASHGARCGCVLRGPYECMVTANNHGQFDPHCDFCAGTGIVVKRAVAQTTSPYRSVEPEAP